MPLALEEAKDGWRARRADDGWTVRGIVALREHGCN